MEFGILGPLEVRSEGQVVAVPGSKQRQLLAILLLHANEVVGSERLSEALWQRPPGSGVNALQVRVSQLRKALDAGGAALETRPSGYLLRLLPGQLDLDRFEQLVAAAQQAADPGEAAVKLREALALWRGPPLGEFSYEEFAQAPIARLEELRVTALERRIDADLELGHHAEVVGELEQLIAEHPLRERLRAQLMLTLYRSGRQAEALDVFQKTRRVLVEELGIEPGLELQELERAILNHDPALLLEPALPPLKNLSQTHLPIPATPFLSREKELAEVMDLLSREEVRLVTLTGPGGTGKTRLALQAAGLASDAYPNGVWWVPLTALHDPELVLPTTARALGANTPLAEHIGESRMLLLLDNFEQVVEAAPGLSGLLAACPNLSVLVTSRELLRVQGELEYPVPPLAEPEAVELFCARSRLEPGEETAELCRRLDHLPLAVELAAARTSVLSPAQILERLSHRLDLLTGGPRDADPRQQTLRATIEWSHDLLSGAERQLFARLSVFTGGCRLKSAEEVAEADLDRLQSLVEKSLLRNREERFWMLETIREYAAERLEDSGEAEELERRHAEHFLALAEEAEPNLPGSPKEWLERLAREHDNLRAALDRLEASGETQLALRLAGALSLFWVRRGHPVEGRRRLERALRADERPTAARAKALTGASALALEGGDAATARLRIEQGLALHRTLGDPWSIARSRYSLAYMLGDQGDFARAQPLFEESVRAFRELGDEHYTLRATFCLAWMYEELGDLERSRVLHEDNLRRAHALSRERTEADTLHELARFALRDGRVEDALSMLKQSLRINHGLGIPLSTAQDLSGFAGALALDGRAGTATRLLSSSEALHKEIGFDVRSYLARRNAETLTTIRRQLDDAAFAEAWEQGQALTLDEAVALALDS